VKSRLYKGIVRHRRVTPRNHQFQYRVFMPYLCLDELPDLFADKSFWSATGRALGEFRRSDFLGDPKIPLADEVRRRIREETGKNHTGPIYLLANLRYFGHIMNPIACYYCFDDDESQLQFLVTEVNNTPWNERHSYVLPGAVEGEWLKTQFDKALHVSPFNPMTMRYLWRSNTPKQRLFLHMENINGGEKVFDATLSLSAQPITAANLNRNLVKYPFMTVKIAFAIYWQALRLFLKGVPLHAHPNKRLQGASNE